MENSNDDAMGTAVIVISLLSIVMGLLLRIIFESRVPFFIRVIFGVVFIVLLLFAIIIFVGALIHDFRKKSKGNIVDSAERNNNKTFLKNSRDKYK